MKINQEIEDLHISNFQVPKLLKKLWQWLVNKLKVEKSEWIILIQEVIEKQELKIIENMVAVEEVAMVAVEEVAMVAVAVEEAVVAEVVEVADVACSAEVAPVDLFVLIVVKQVISPENVLNHEVD